MTDDTKPKKQKNTNRFLKALALSVGLSSVSPSEATHINAVLSSSKDILKYIYRTF